MVVRTFNSVTDVTHFLLNYSQLFRAQMEAAHDTDVSKDDRAESLHRHRREHYRMRMERETPEEAEVRRARRKERDGHN